MKNFIFASVALTAASLSVAAVADFSTNLRGRDADRLTNLSERTAFSKTSTPFGKPAPRKAMKKVIGVSGDDLGLIDELGTLHLKLEEDFSLLTMGTPDNPDMDVDMSVNSMELFGNAWYTFNSEYTHAPNWGMHNCYPAGGTLYMHGESDQVSLNTPLIKLDDYSGMAVLEFKIRTFDAGDVFDDLLIEAAETRGMGPTWDILEDTSLVGGINGEWGTIRVLYRGAGPSTMFNIVTNNIGRLLIDDVKVYELEPFVGMPETLPHSDYAGTSFTANWSPVEGADHYLLSVYEYDPQDHEQVFVMQDVEVGGTSKVVTGVESGEIYYYTVKAVKNGKTSIESFEQRVYDLEVPVLKTAEMIGEHSYKASWNPVPNADVYNYWAYDIRKAEETGDFIVTQEDFYGIQDGIVDDYGEPVTWSKDNPDQYSYDEYYPTSIHQQGWRGTHCAPYDDCLALDSWWYEWVGEQAGFISPEMDLSKDGGRFTVEADLAGLTTEYWDGSKYAYVTTQACVALFNWDVELGDYKQVELVYIPKGQDINQNWCHRTFQLTKGSARSTIGIFAIRGLDWLFVDNLKITQKYQAGESLLEPFRLSRFYGSEENVFDPTTIEIDVPYYASGKEVYHKVSAYRRMADERNQRYDDCESRYSDMEFVGITTQYESAVKGLTLVEPSATQKDGVLAIHNPAGVEVSVADINGRTIFRTSDCEATFTLPARGVYVVGNTKIIY